MATIRIPCGRPFHR